MEVETTTDKMVTTDLYHNFTDFINLTSSLEIITETSGSSGVQILDTLDTILTAVGFVLNLGSLVTFIRHGDAFGFPIKHLLTHQIFLDMVTCLLGVIIHVQPQTWSVNNYHWEAINCYLWHSQYFFWYFLYTSANNLVYLAYDRYRAVVHPLHYKDVSKSKVYCGMFLTHVYSLLVRWPVLLWVGMEGNVCVHGWFIKGEWADLTVKLYSIFEFLVHYLVHMVALVYFYGSVIRTTRKALKSSESTTSAATQKALSVVTKASIAVTVVFILTFSWMYCNYIFGVFIGWFKLGTTIQKTNVLMGSINSACNPIFYYWFMPSFRRAVAKTFLPCVMTSHLRDADRSSSNGTVSSVATVCDANHL